MNALWQDRPDKPQSWFAQETRKAEDIFLTTENNAVGTRAEVRHVAGH